MLNDLAERLSHTFVRTDLLERAVTHRSAKDLGGGYDYERLEFLGDRVLGLVIAELLFSKFKKEPEGALARRHAALVRREALSEVAEEIGLGEFLVLAKGEEDAGERENPSLLANACEAVIAALYIDGGLEVARRFILAHWTTLAERVSEPPRDNKTGLQEWAQARGLPLPVYKEMAREGPAHEPLFTIEVSVQEMGAARGQGRSKRLAEQAAAGVLLERLEGANADRVSGENTGR
ncbi:MAG: ribonuclease III [Kiloniellales bacterium]|nr:ribonuclease III [Kiloniellales bacterium]